MPHAQYEIRTYAQTIGEKIVQPLFPLVWEAFVDYQLQSISLTRLEGEVIVRLVEHLSKSGRSRGTADDFLAVQDPTWTDLHRSREARRMPR